MEAGTIRDAPPRAEGFTPADYAQHMMALKKKVPEGFSVVLSQPFAVVGEGTPEAVRRYADSTVKWTVTRIKADYFQKDPDDDHRRLALQGRCQLPQGRQGDLRRHPDDAVRLLLGPAQGPDHEHRHRRRDAGARDRPPVHAGELPGVPRLVQRGAGVAVRAVGGPRRAHPRPDELAAGGPAAGHQGQDADHFQGPLRHDHQPVLQPGQGEQLRPGPISMLLTCRRRACW